MDGLLDMFLLLAIVSVLSALLRSALPWLKGRFSGLLVHFSLRQSLPASHYTIMHNVTLRTGRGTTRIDHIVVSPYGIFVIEAKRMVGTISGSREDVKWTRAWFRSKRKFPNPLHRNDINIKVLSQLLKLDISHFYSLVVFAGSAGFKTQMPINVTKPGGMLPYILVRTRPLLEFEEAERLAAVIESSAHGRGMKTRAEHATSLKAKHFSGSGAMTLATPVLLLVSLLFIGGNLMQKLSDASGISAFPEVSAKVQQSPFLEHAAPPNINLPSVVKNESGILNETGKQADRARRAHESMMVQGDREKRLAWEASLMCGYSAEARICSCYEPGGGKADIEFENCKVLAENVSLAVSR